MELNKAFLNYVDKHEKELIKFFKQNAHEFNKILSEISESFSTTLLMTRSYSKFYTTINHKGDILYSYGLDSECRSIKNFFKSVPKFIKKMTNSSYTDAELRIKMIETFAMTIQHLVNVYANPICISIEFGGDCWEETNPYHSIAIRYKNYFNHMKKISESYLKAKMPGIMVVEVLFELSEVYYHYTENKNLKNIYVLIENMANNDEESDDYDYEGVVVNAREEIFDNAVKLKIDDYYGECVGYSYCQMYDDPWDI